MAEKLTDKEKGYHLLVRNTFAISAPFYDAGVSPFFGVRDRTVNFTNAQKGSKILDIATRAGQQAFVFAKKVY